MNCLQVGGGILRSKAMGSKVLQINPAINHKGNWLGTFLDKFGWTKKNLLERDLNLYQLSYLALHWQSPYFVNIFVQGVPVRSHDTKYWQNRETANIGLDSSVGRAPARQSGGCRFKSRSSKCFFVHPNLQINPVYRRYHSGHLGYGFELHQAL